MRRAGMIGSEAGLVRIEKVILTSSATTADSGPTCLEGKNWRNWSFTVEIPSGSTFGVGLLVTWYFTNDPNTAGSLPGTPPILAVPITAANWFKIPARTDQTGTGVEANPINAAGQSLSFDKPVLAIRAVISGNTPGNVVNCRVAATP